MSHHLSISLEDLQPREAIIDTICRLAEGVDDNNEWLFRSAITNDTVFDLSGFNSFEPPQPFGRIEGADEVTSAFLGKLGGLDTAHHLGNFRVNIAHDGRQAELTCYAFVEHFLPGQGPSPRFQSHFSMGTRYWCEVVRGSADEAGIWRIKKMNLTCQWSHGDKSVIEN